MAHHFRIPVSLYALWVWLSLKQGGVYPNQSKGTLPPFLSGSISGLFFLVPFGSRYGVTTNPKLDVHELLHWINLSASLNLGGCVFLSGCPFSGLLQCDVQLWKGRTDFWAKSNELTDRRGETNGSVVKKHLVWSLFRLRNWGRRYEPHIGWRTRQEDNPLLYNGYHKSQFLFKHLKRGVEVQ